MMYDYSIHVIHNDIFYTAESNLCLLLVIGFLDGY